MVCEEEKYKCINIGNCLFALFSSEIGNNSNSMVCAPWCLRFTDVPWYDSMLY